jgi:hypothetical protein
MFCASVVYPADAVGFDFEYFATIHAPMFAGILGTNCERFEVRRPLASPGAPQPPFAAAATSGSVIHRRSAQHSLSMATTCMPTSPTSASRRRLVGGVRSWAALLLVRFLGCNRGGAVTRRNAELVAPVGRGVPGPHTMSSAAKR